RLRIAALRPRGEPRRDPIDHLTKRVLPPTNVYPVKRGHRRDVLVPHKQGMLVRWPCSLPATRPPDSRLRAPATHTTNYGRSTRRRLDTRRGRIKGMVVTEAAA